MTTLLLIWALVATWYAWELGRRTNKNKDIAEQLESETHRANFVIELLLEVALIAGAKPKKLARTYIGNLNFFANDSDLDYTSAEYARKTLKLVQEYYHRVDIDELIEAMEKEHLRHQKKLIEEGSIESAELLDKKASHKK